MEVASFSTTCYILYRILSAIDIGQSVNLWGEVEQEMTKCPSKKDTPKTRWM